MTCPTSGSFRARRSVLQQPLLCPESGLSPSWIDRSNPPPTSSGTVLSAIYPYPLPFPSTTQSMSIPAQYSLPPHPLPHVPLSFVFRLPFWHRHSSFLDAVPASRRVYDLTLPLSAQPPPPSYRPSDLPGRGPWHPNALILGLSVLVSSQPRAFFPCSFGSQFSLPPQN